MNDEIIGRGTSSLGDKPHYIFELYMLGTTPSSARAVVNLRKICDRYLKDRYDLAVIDVSVDRASAKIANIIAAPTLVVRSPLPERRLVGDLSNEEQVVARLELQYA